MSPIKLLRMKLLTVVSGILHKPPENHDPLHHRLVFGQERAPGRDFAGWWELPGGKMEHGETAEVALRREIQEELGLRLPAQLDAFSLTLTTTWAPGSRLFGSLIKEETRFQQTFLSATLTHDEAALIRCDPEVAVASEWQTVRAWRKRPRNIHLPHLLMLDHNFAALSMWAAFNSR